MGLQVRISTYPFFHPIPYSGGPTLAQGREGCKSCSKKQLVVTRSLADKINELIAFLTTAAVSYGHIPNIH